MKKTHVHQRSPLALKNFPAAGAIILACIVMNCSIIHAQTLRGKVYFSDSRVETVELEKEYFEKSNGLKTAEGGRIIPLNSIVKLEIAEQFFMPRTVVLRQVDKVDEKTGHNYPKTDTTLLLQQLVGGSMSLFSFGDTGNKPHLFIEKDTAIKELVQVEYQKGNKAGTRDWYKGVLTLMMGDCPDIPREKIDNLKFSISHIEKLIVQYNKNCGALNYYSPSERLNVKFGPQAGLSYFRSTFGEVSGGVYGNDVSEYFEKFSEIGPYSATLAQVGGFVEFQLISKLQREAHTSFNFHFQVSSKARLEYAIERTHPFRTDTIFISGYHEANYFELGLTLQRSIAVNRPGFSPFFGAGLGLRNWFNVDNAETFIDANRPIWYDVTEQEAIPGAAIPNYFLFGQVMAGANIGRFQVAIVFQLPESGLTSHRSESHFDLGLTAKYRLN